MIGFIKGIFQRQPSNVDESQPTEASPKPQKKAAAFFLDPDDAKTFGDIDYMRTAKSVRRTFPKYGNNAAGFEKIVQISALKSIGAADPQAAASMLEISTPKTAETTFAPAPELDNQSDKSADKSDSKVEQRRTDTSLDMFRSMAREIRKR